MERFWEKVEITDDDSCWEWQASVRGNSGYGAFKLDGKTQSAHRVSWFLTHGEWSQQLICHHCDNRLCVNPLHLFEGSYSDNLLDAYRKERVVSPNRPPTTHGKLTMYDKYGCRCAKCRATKSIHNAKRYK